MSISSGSVKEISITSLPELELFLEHAGRSLKSFRYFEKRPLDIIREHLVTLLYRDSEAEFPIGYGHLDQEANKIWLGVCVSEKHTGKGVGKKLMDYLLKVAKKDNLKIIHLSVDAENEKAIKLYEKFGFRLKDRKDDVIFMELELR